MGGVGSGQFGGRVAVEDCIGISTADLLRFGYLKESASPYSVIYRNCLGQWLYTLDFDVCGDGERLMLYLRQSGQSVALESTPLHFGGRRWWFKCPGCGRRCATLHKPLGRSAFACRLCCNLTYRSSLESRPDGVCGLSRGAIAKARRAQRVRFVRKRDRRPDYKPRGWRLEQIKKAMAKSWLL